MNRNQIFNSQFWDLDYKTISEEIKNATNVFVDKII